MSKLEKRYWRIKGNLYTCNQEKPEHYLGTNESWGCGKTQAEAVEDYIRWHHNHGIKWVKVLKVQPT